MLGADGFRINYRVNRLQSIGGGEVTKFICVSGLLSLLFSVVVGNGMLLAGTKVHVGERVPRDQLIALVEIEHTRWTTLLQRYVDADGMVNYRDWKASAVDVRSLDQYLQQLSSAKLSGDTSRKAKLAFWINAYNAVTVRGILREFPTSSIRNHTARFIGYNIWNDLLLPVDDKNYSLNQMEHDILRKMNEPRIHFAIVCASKGCPRLLNEAYVEDRLERQLEQNAKDFFARRQNFQHQMQQSRFRTSSILDWFKEDFGASQAARLKTIAPWLPTQAAQQAAINNTVSVDYLPYNWELNAQPSRTD